MDLLYRGQSGSGINWNGVEAAAEWEAYTEQPCTSHSEYVRLLKRVLEKYPDAMAMTD